MNIFMFIYKMWTTCIDIVQRKVDVTLDLKWAPYVVTPNYMQENLINLTQMKYVLHPGSLYLCSNLVYST